MPKKPFEPPFGAVISPAPVAPAPLRPATPPGGAAKPGFDRNLVKPGHNHGPGRPAHQAPRRRPPSVR